jgi:2,4-dienoyl-CoA reductase-like NADH-dependent reductase (Old Yellow Enzyme family)
MEQNDLSTLLSPSELPGGRRAGNRIVMPPMVIWRGDKSAEVTDGHLRHYAESAPGTGIAIVEATAVSPEGRLAATVLGLFEDRQIPGMGDLVRSLRRAGTLPGIQLNHAGGKTDTEKTYGLRPVAPSGFEDRPEVEQLEETGILRIIEDFVSAAKRAVEAGFELLELHGAHGYLGSQFLSPRTNRRKDRWGGSLENRLRFLRELVKQVRDAVDGKALLSCRLGVAEGDPEGLGIEDGVEAAKILAGEGLDLIHVSHAGSKPAPLEADSPFDPVMQLAKPVRRAVEIPVIGVGGIVEPIEAEEALRAEYADFVAPGRAILADPGWARKTSEGKVEQIVRCRQCEPRCYHHTNPKLCPTRNRLGIQPPGL